MWPGVVELLVYSLLAAMGLHWGGVLGLECFACHDIKSKYRCRTTQICNSGEICLVQKVHSAFIDQGGESQESTYYNMACKKRDKCLNTFYKSTNFNVKSKFLSECCCSDFCLEEDGTGYGDYSNCYNALTYEEARSQTSFTSKENSSYFLIYFLFVLQHILVSVV